MAEAAPPAARTTAPYVAQNAHSVRQLVQSLKANETRGWRQKKKGGFSCKKTAFELPQLGGRELASWKMNDWDYKRDDLPTYARGIFTYERQDGLPEIGVRGYDKFFNIEEVNDTRWRNIENNTRGPYELSNKENGCIIFVAGLEGDQIVVCSKHSTGDRQDLSANHSAAGKAWLEKHLASVGRTPEQLAKELRARNVTLVAELCDDSFEEHVLEYGPDVAGLYVHGMNLNVPEFVTYPFHLVQQFADEWGLKKAKFIVKDDLEDAKQFLEECGETGSWNGRDTEGFVIRCQKKVSGTWVDWFFKYKYDEPYLMYRQWREATKAVIAGKAPKYKKHTKITEAYLTYARQQLHKNPSLGKEYMKNHGIISMREGFLKQQGVKGSDIIRAEAEEDDADSAKTATHDIVLVPISTIGCGKTTIANALVSLFNFGHVQNDNITGPKGRPQKFANLVLSTLASHPAVIADRNNHQRRERKQIIEDVMKIAPKAKFIALHYNHSPKDQMVPLVRAVTLARVKDRGDNHQTIRASSKDSKEIEGIIDGFLTRFEPPSSGADPDNMFEEIIDMDPRDDSRQNLEVVVEALHKSFPALVPRIPSAEEMDRAIEASLNDYSPQLKHDLSFGGGNNKKERKDKNQQKNNNNGKKKDARVEYFAIKLPHEQIIDCLHETFAHADPRLGEFYRQLQQTGRVQPKFHVTLIHSASSKTSPEVWRNYEERYNEALNGRDVDPYLGPGTVSLEHVIWDDRVMCIAAGIKNEDLICCNAIAHVTIGTVSPEVKPKESNDLLARWQNSGGGFNDSSIHELQIQGASEVHGEVRAVTSATR